MQYLDQFEIEELSNLREIFKDILYKGAENTHCGICLNASKHKLNEKGRINTYRAVSILAADWPYNTIPGGIVKGESSIDGQPIYNAYMIPDGYDSRYAWSGANLMYRQDLLKHLIGKLDLAISERFLTGENTSYNA